MTRLELCDALATDYAHRAKVLRLKFEEAYQIYYKRCEIRTYDNLIEQYQHGNLLTKSSKTPRPKLNKNEYIVSAPADDDCEDGVCKL